MKIVAGNSNRALAEAVAAWLDLELCSVSVRRFADMQVFVEILENLVANLLVEAGANRILTLDLHAMQIQGFFDIPVDNLYTAPLFVRDIQERQSGNAVVIVSPDVGGVVRARQLAHQLNNTDPAIIDKRRERA